MDPLTIVATSLGLAYTCAQAASSVRNALSGFNGARKILDELHGSVRLLVGILEQARACIGNNDYAPADPTFDSQLSSAIQGCDATLTHLMREINRLASLRDRRMLLGFSFSWRETEIKSLIDRLEQNKSSISLVLQIHTTHLLDEIRANATPRASVRFWDPASLPLPSSSPPGFSPGREREESPCPQTPDYDRVVSSQGSSSSSPDAAFDFDDEVVLSGPYQREMMLRERKRKRSSSSDCGIRIFEDEDADQPRGTEVEPAVNVLRNRDNLKTPEGSEPSPSQWLTKKQRTGKAWLSSTCSSVTVVDRGDVSATRTGHGPEVGHNG